MILAPAELRVGVMTAILGGPVFVWLARSLRPGEAR
jgi:iron complex transport system permease protein